MNSVVRAAAQGETAGGQQTASLAAQAPFQLSNAEQQQLDQVLRQWEQSSNRINTFKCKFKRWDYDPLGPKSADGLKSFAVGEIKYKKPDKGMYQVTEMSEYVPVFQAAPKPGEKPKPVPPPKYEPRTEGLDHWVCDGESIYEFVSAQKQLVEHRLPPEVKGQGITDGPIPFIFGAKADKLKQRYFLRLLPSPDANNVWLEARPRFQADAANFQVATMILAAGKVRGELTPFALKIELPGGSNRTAYQFFDTVVNDPLGFLKGDFGAPRAPAGWKVVVDQPRTGIVEPPQSPGGIEERKAAPVSSSPLPQARLESKATTRK